jgi:hypothetical protein
LTFIVKKKLEINIQISIIDSNRKENSASSESIFGEYKLELDELSSQNRYLGLAGSTADLFTIRLVCD